MLPPNTELHPRGDKSKIPYGKHYRKIKWMIILHRNCDTILKFFQTETFSRIDPAGPIHTDPDYEGGDSDEEYEKMMAQYDEDSDSHM